MFGSGEMEEFREDVFGEDVRVYGGDELDEFHLGHEVSENVSSVDIARPTR